MHAVRIVANQHSKLVQASRQRGVGGMMSGVGPVTSAPGVPGGADSAPAAAESSEETKQTPQKNKETKAATQALKDALKREENEDLQNAMDKAIAAGNVDPQLFHRVLESKPAALCHERLQIVLQKLKEHEDRVNQISILIKKKDKQSMTPIHKAAKAGSGDLVWALLELYKEHADTLDTSAPTSGEQLRAERRLAAQDAVQYNNLDAIKLLVNDDELLTAAGADGILPIHYVSSKEVCAC